jgi:hypothetical protein
MTKQNDPSDEIRTRLGAVVTRLSRIAQSTGTLDAAEIHAALTVAEHEIGQVQLAMKRLPRP